MFQKREEFLYQLTADSMVGAFINCKIQQMHLLRLQIRLLNFPVNLSVRQSRYSIRHNAVATGQISEVSCIHSRQGKENIFVPKRQTASGVTHSCILCALTVKWPVCRTDHYLTPRLRRTGSTSLLPHLNSYYSEGQLPRLLQLSPKYS